MSFEYYRAQDSPAANERRSSRLKGREVESTPRVDLNQAGIRSRKRKVLADNTILNVTGTPGARKTRSEALEVDKSKGKTEATTKPEKDPDVTAEIKMKSPRKTPTKLRTPAKPKTPLKAVEKEAEETPQLLRSTKKFQVSVKRKAETELEIPHDSDVPSKPKRFRKNPPLESESILTTKGFAERIRKQIPNALAKIGTPGLEEPVTQFVDKFLSENGSIRFLSKKEAAEAPKSLLPPHPRSKVLIETEQRQRRRLAMLQEQAATWKGLASKTIKPECTDSDLEFPGADAIANYESLLQDDERHLFEQSAKTPFDFRTGLENVLLQSDELLLRARQLVQFADVTDDYFSRVARALRREEIGDSAPLTFGSKR